jgi:hypothetical protein
MPNIYAFISNHNYNNNNLCKKVNTYIPEDIDISHLLSFNVPIMGIDLSNKSSHHYNYLMDNGATYYDVVNKHKKMTNKIPLNFPMIIDSITQSLVAHHNAIHRQLQNMAIGLFFLIFIRKYWHR